MENSKFRNNNTSEVNMGKASRARLQIPYSKHYLKVENGSHRLTFLHNVAFEPMKKLRDLALGRIP